VNRSGGGGDHCRAWAIGGLVPSGTPTKSSLGSYRSRRHLPNSTTTYLTIALHDWLFSIRAGSLRLRTKHPNGTITDELVTVQTLRSVASAWRKWAAAPLTDLKKGFCREVSSEWYIHLSEPGIGNLVGFKVDFRRQQRRIRRAGIANQMILGNPYLHRGLTVFMIDTMDTIAVVIRTTIVERHKKIRHVAEGSTTPERGKSWRWWRAPKSGFSGHAMTLRPRLRLSDVLRLQAFRSLGHIELYSLTFLQATEAVTADGWEMHENIFASLTANKAEALGIVKPLHCSLFHFSFLNRSWISAEKSRCHWEGVTLKVGTNYQLRAINTKADSI
jgi:hypothetical protein